LPSSKRRSVHLAACSQSVPQQGKRADNCAAACAKTRS
jgi:hypothetical protein